MKTATANDVLSWKPCGYDGEDDGRNYTPARIKRLFGRKKKITTLDMLAMDIPVDDRFWAVCRGEMLSARTLRIFACDCAERALKRARKAGREPDPRSWEAVKVARRFADGKASDEELAAAWAAASYTAWDARAAAWDAARAAARDAARAAARAAAWAAAWAAARNAAWAAAWDAAWAAARNAAWAAAWDAAWAAARDAEQKWQVKRLVKLAKEEK